MTKRFLIALALVLLAGTGFAQIGGTPGISGPLANPVLTGNVNATGAVFTGAQPLCFEGATADAFETCFAITDPTAIDKTITFPNLTGTVLLGGAANSFAAATTSVTFTGATNATPLFSLADDDTLQNFLTFTDVGTPANTIVYRQDVNNGLTSVISSAAGGSTTMDVDNGYFRVWSDAGIEGEFSVGPGYLHFGNSDATAAAISLLLDDDATDKTWLQFTDRGNDNGIWYTESVNTGSWSTTAYNGATAAENTLAGSLTGLTYDFSAPVNADVAFALADDDTAQNWLTFTDVATATNVIAFQQDVNTPSFYFDATSAVDQYARVNVEGDISPIVTISAMTPAAGFNIDGVLTVAYNELDFAATGGGLNAVEPHLQINDSLGNWLTFLDYAGSVQNIEYGHNVSAADPQAYTKTYKTATVWGQLDVLGSGVELESNTAGVDSKLALTYNSLDFDLTNAVNADVALTLADDDTAQDFLVFTDVGTPTNVVTLRQDVNTPNLSLIAASAANDGTITIDGDATPVINLNVDALSVDITTTDAEFDMDIAAGDAVTNDQIRLNPGAAGGAAFDVLLTTVDVTGSDKTVTFADASGTVMLTTVANNGTGNAGSVTGGTNAVVFEGTTGGDGFELTLSLNSEIAADNSVYISDLSEWATVNPTAAPLTVTATTTGYTELSALGAASIADSGGAGAPAAVEIEPVPGVSVYAITCNDATDACPVTIVETSAVPGMRITIVSIATAGFGVALADQAGVFETTGALALVTPVSSIEAVYVNGAFYQSQAAVVTIP